MRAFPEYVLEGVVLPERIRPDRLIVYGIRLQNGRAKELARFRASVQALEEAGPRAAGRVAIYFMNVPEGQEAWQQPGLVRLVGAMMAECPHFLYFTAPSEAVLKPVLFCLSDRRLREMLEATAAYGRRVGRAAAAQRTINLARRILYLAERPQVSGRAPRGAEVPGQPHEL